MGDLRRAKVGVDYSHQSKIPEEAVIITHICWSRCATQVKQFKNQTALNHLDFSVESEIFGILDLQVQAKQPPLKPNRSTTASSGETKLLE